MITNADDYGGFDCPACDGGGAVGMGTCAMCDGNGRIPGPGRERLATKAKTLTSMTDPERQEVLQAMAHAIGVVAHMCRIETPGFFLVLFDEGGTILGASKSEPQEVEEVMRCLIEKMGWEVDDEDE